ncbi:MAG: DedA family protein [Micrococcaceae bacterium]
MNGNANPHLFDASHILHEAGPWVFLVIGIFVLIETGALPIGIFFPGDSLLFTAGALTAAGKLTTPQWSLYLVTFIATFFGGIVGYYFGKQAGSAFFNKPDSMIFNKENILKTHKFYAKYGKYAVIFGRFLPFIRTFNPIIAGIGKMDFQKFVTYNFIGSLIWCFWMPSLGYLIARQPYLKSHLPMFFGVLIVIGVTGFIIENYKAIKNKKAGKDPAAIIDKKQG